MWSNCEPQAAFEAIKLPQISAPCATAAKEGSTDITLAGNGGRNRITQTVDSSAMTIVNETLPSHQFHRGSVTWQVSKGALGFGSSISVVGNGAGPNPTLNNAVGIAFFGAAANAAAVA